MEANLSVSKLTELYEEKRKLENQIRPLRLKALRVAIIERSGETPNKLLNNLVEQLDCEVKKAHLCNSQIDDLMDQLDRYLDLE
jgi:small-conductance mechanosensitive channel